MSKNKHNENIGSSIERTDDRINSTGEVFTSMTFSQRQFGPKPINYIPKSFIMTT